MIDIEAFVNKAPDKVWDLWTRPEHIVQWNSASPDWHTPRAENDLRPGGRFTSRMEARDGSMGFDFGGVYDDVIPFEHISYTLDDGRKAIVSFEPENSGTRLRTSFQPENQNPEEMQRSGWQAILNNFKSYAESL
jgi:uncharacterized protein YndB with AHSA1/START domain